MPARATLIEGGVHFSREILKRDGVGQRKGSALKEAFDVTRSGVSTEALSEDGFQVESESCIACSGPTPLLDFWWNNADPKRG
jgi:hypothetical protein